MATFYHYKERAAVSALFLRTVSLAVLTGVSVGFGHSAHGQEILGSVCTDNGFVGYGSTTLEAAQEWCDGFATLFGAGSTGEYFSAEGCAVTLPDGTPRSGRRIPSCQNNLVCELPDGTYNDIGSQECEDAEEEEPDLACPEAGTPYGSLGNICTVGGILSDIFTPVVDFTKANPNNPSQSPDGPLSCIISRSDFESPDWVYNGPSSGEANDSGEYVECPPDAEPEDDPTELEEEGEENEEEEPNPDDEGKDEEGNNIPDDFDETEDIPDEDPFSASISGDCDVAPTCSGNSSQCAIVYQVYESHCGSDAKLLAKLDDVVDAIETDGQEETEALNSGAEDAQKSIDRRIQRIGKVFEDADADLNGRREGILDSLDEVAESDEDNLDGVDIDQPDWIADYFPQAGGCESISYSYAGQSGSFPPAGGCDKINTFKQILGWALYLYLAFVAYRAFFKARTS